MTTVDIDAKIPNNVDLAGDRRLQRALESWQPKFIEWWKELGPVALPGQRRLPAHGDRRRPGGLGQLRPRRDARLPLGHLPRRARARPPHRLRRPPRRAGVAGGARRVPRRPAPAARRPGRHRAGVGRAAAAAVPDGARASTTCATCSRSTSRRAATCGRWCTCCTATSGATAATRPTRCSSATPATPTTRASSARSTSRRRTGCRSSSSPTSPTATASSSWRRCARVGVRPAVADVRLHAQGGGPPHVRRRHRRRPGRAAHRRADEGARHRRRPPVRRHRRRHAAALPQLPLQRVARPVRRRDVDERGQLLRRRAQGPVPGGAPRRRPPPARRDAARCPHVDRRRDRRRARRRRWRRSTRRCATTTSPTAEGRRPLEPHARRGRRSS